MVLEVEADTRQIDKWLDASFAKLLGITDTRSIKELELWTWSPDERN